MPDAVASMVRGWQALVESVRPVAVIADFAPACLLACRGRVPSIAIGDGFTLPPPTMETFTQFENGPPKYDERDLVGSVNEGLRNTHGAAIERLPEIFAADRHCTGSFVELDPYAPHRRIATVAPWAPDWDRAVATRRTEVFAYIGVQPPLMATLVEAFRYVVADGIAVRLHIPSMDSATDAAFSGTGAIIEKEPIPFEADPPPNASRRFVWQFRICLLRTRRRNSADRIAGRNGHEVYGEGSAGARHGSLDKTNAGKSARRTVARPGDHRSIPRRRTHEICNCASTRFREAPEAVTGRNRRRSPGRTRVNGYLCSTGGVP